MGKARSSRAVFPRGDESKVESNGRRVEAPEHCVFVVMTTSQLVRGSDLVISLCQMVCGVAVALGDRSRIAVALSVRCDLFLLSIFNRRAVFRR